MENFDLLPSCQFAYWKNLITSDAHLTISHIPQNAFLLPLVAISVAYIFCLFVCATHHISELVFALLWSPVHQGVWERALEVMKVDISTWDMQIRLERLKASVGGCCGESYDVIQGGGSDDWLLIFA